ncbi:25285_t:CDS:2, partial [Racocetra persica]
MWKVFGSEQLPLLKSNTKASAIVKWKKNLKINNCHCLLFEQNDDGVFWISIIARFAFLEVIVPNLTNEHCAFALTNDFNNDRPSYNSPEMIMDEAEGSSRALLLQEDMDELF